MTGLLLPENKVCRTAQQGFPGTNALLCEHLNPPSLVLQILNDLYVGHNNKPK